MQKMKTLTALAAAVALAACAGKNGADGATGPQGAQGATGAAGQNGQNGTSIGTVAGTVTYTDKTGAAQPAAGVTVTPAPLPSGVTAATSDSSGAYSLSLLSTELLTKGLPTNCCRSLLA